MVLHQKKALSSIRSWLFAIGNFFLVAQASVANADNSYSSGLSAYINGNYEVAQTKWLESAKQENLRAMFNLGLLHQENKISGASQAKARRWFRLAGKGGYAAADYHHAKWLLKLDESPDQISLYLQRAISNGYQPAKDELVTLAKSGVALPKLNLPTNPPTDVGENMSASGYLNESWLLQRNSRAWTIQLLAFEDLSKVTAFIDDHSLLEKAAYFVERVDDKVLYKLVYGEFDSKLAAESARTQLASDLKAHGPWLRPFQSVQEIIGRQ